MKLVYSILFLFVLLACNTTTESTELTNDDKKRQVEEGHFEGYTYQSDLISWRMDYPTSARLTSLKSLKSTDGNARNLEGKDLGQMKYLLAFQSNFDNNFRATAEPFSQSELIYRQIMNSNRAAIFNAYLDGRQSADTSSSMEVIDGQKLDVFHLGLFKGAKKFADQWMFTTLRKNHYCTFIINSNRESSSKLMLEKFRASTFEK